MEINYVFFFTQQKTKESQPTLNKLAKPHKPMLNPNAYKRACVLRDSQYYLYLLNNKIILIDFQSLAKQKKSIDNDFLAFFAFILNT
jgi:hypothetical protein